MSAAGSLDLKAFVRSSSAIPPLFRFSSLLLATMRRTLFTWALVANLAAAVDFTNWSPPGPNDVRGPCPGLNSLANHNILPHSGKGITVSILTKALADGFNMGADFSTAIGNLAMLSTPLLQGYLNLDNLDKHNFPLEHDASLSRQDYYFGDDHTFNQTIWNSVLAFYPTGPNVNITMQPAALARYNRVKVEAKRDPTFTYTPYQFLISYADTALYLSVMGNPITGIAPRSWVEMFFGMCAISELANPIRTGKASLLARMATADHSDQSCDPSSDDYSAQYCFGRTNSRRIDHLCEHAEACAPRSQSYYGTAANPLGLMELMN
jgi:hypothetical protein